jgi:hypothetical protein
LTELLTEEHLLEEDLSLLFGLGQEMLFGGTVIRQINLMKLHFLRLLFLLTQQHFGKALLYIHQELLGK